tara:strand:+ start:232 stop:582 length:351 start_codon:yes stop_codon:yes gene_type:complete
MTRSIIVKRIQRVRKKLKRVNRKRFRLSVHRSSKNISAQIIDDINNKTVVSASSIEKDKKKTKAKKIEMSNNIAELLAKRALEKKITNVFFDRGRYKYHGRIKTFAETLRKNGLNF